MELDGFLDAVSRCRPGGASARAWSVYATTQRRMSLGVKDREAGNIHAPLDLAEGAGARYLIVWSDGLVSRGSLERRQVEQEPQAALEQARSASYDDPDAAHVLGPAPIPDVCLHDEATARAAMGDTEEFVERLSGVRRRVADRGLRTWSGSFSAAAGRARLVTSAGLDAEGNGTTASWYASLNGELGNGHSARAFDTAEEFAARLDRLVELVEELGRPGEPLRGGVLPVLLHPDVVERYVLDTLLHNLQGSTVANEEGHFRREQFGADEQVLRDDLTLRMDPLLPLRSGSYRFTVEGVPAARCTFVDRGRLLRPIVDIKYGRRLGIAPTPIPYSADTLFLEGPEPLPLERALSEARGGVLVLSVLGVHTQDPASGDFSLSAPQALRVGRDGFGGRLRCTVSGNLFAVLRSPDLSLVRFEGEHTPGLLFPCRVE